jgi:hypothetical protein
MTEEAAVEEAIQGYGLTLNDERKWFQPAFEVLAATSIHVGGVCMGHKEVHVSWHWTFRQGRDRLNALHGELVTKAMQEAWWGSQVRDPDGPPVGLDGSAS